MAKGLSGQGANVEVFAEVEAIYNDGWDVIIVALQPTSSPRIGCTEAQQIAAVTPPGTTVVQFWGDVHHDALLASGLKVWPSEAPPTGHMAALLSEIGPEPIVRLQTGGLRAAEWTFRGGADSLEDFAQLVQST
jgi:hypothetical protein